MIPTEPGEYNATPKSGSGLLGGERVVKVRWSYGPGSPLVVSVFGTQKSFPIEDFTDWQGPFPSLKEEK
jgi:hypothetical protein